jgi:hypothetical protein
MYDQLRLTLKKKYSLVHVPNRHKVARWIEETESLHSAGNSLEQAGLIAARRIFPYEVKEHGLHMEAPVGEILKIAADVKPRLP